MIFERLEGVDGELHDRDVRLREQVGKHAPGAMVETPFVIIRADPTGLHRLGDFSCEIGQTRCRIFEGEQLRREAVEIMDGARPRHRSDRGRPDEPVCGNDEQRAGPRQRFAETAPGPCEAVEF